MTTRVSLIFSCLRRLLALLYGINQPAALAQRAQAATIFVATPVRYLLTPSTRLRPDSARLTDSSVGPFAVKSSPAIPHVRTALLLASFSHFWAVQNEERLRNTHETDADQRHPGRRTPPGDRRWTKTPRLRNRNRRARTAQGQHLQGRRHPRRAFAGSLLCRLRRRPPRLSAVQGNLQAVLRARRAGQPGAHQRRDPRRPGTAGPGRKGRARQQGRGPDHLRLAGRPLCGADAQQPARRWRVAPHRGRRPGRTQRERWTSWNTPTA